MICIVAFVVACDAAFAGYRAGLGRDGRLRRTPFDASDILDQCWGLLVGLVLALPPVALMITHPDQNWSHSASTVAVFVVPYALVVVGALFAYAILGWRARFVAMAVVLGPLTLARFPVALVALFTAASHHQTFTGWLVGLLGLAMVGAVEPVTGWWLKRRRPLWV